MKGQPAPAFRMQLFVRSTAGRTVAVVIDRGAPVSVLLREAPRASWVRRRLAKGAILFPERDAHLAGERRQARAGGARQHPGRPPISSFWRMRGKALSAKTCANVSAPNLARQ